MPATDSTSSNSSAATPISRGLQRRCAACLAAALLLAAALQLILHGPGSAWLWLIPVALIWPCAIFCARPVASAVQRLTEALARLEAHVTRLESQRNQAEAILESMVEGVIALDRAGHILSLNGSARRLFSLTPEQAAGKRFSDVFRHPDIESVIQEARLLRRPALRELQVFDPHERAIQFRVTPGGEVNSEAAFILVAQDVTEMRRLERLRREFVANVSHELKTPLTSIKGLVETLQSGALDDAQHNRRFLGLIEEDAARLGRLIDDLLELSQIESKAVPLAREQMTLAGLIAEVLATLQPASRQRRLTVSVEVPQDLAIVADPHRLRQVLVNLLENAIKYNVEGGRITVSASRDASSATIVVADTGVGIPAQDLPRIFERFYRVDKARSRALGGTGLGLSIVKHIVEAHGGRVAVDSQPAVGSTFTISLPQPG